MTAPDTALAATAPKAPVESVWADLEGLGQLLRDAGQGEVDPEDVKRRLEIYWQDHEAALRAEASAMTDQARLQTIEALNKWREQLAAHRQASPETASPPDSAPPGVPTVPTGVHPSAPSVDSGRMAVQAPNAGTTTARRESVESRRSRDIRMAAACEEPDVLLDVLLKVELIELLVEELRAQVAVQAERADLLELSVGAAASFDRVALKMENVEADVHLNIRLDEAGHILDSALTCLCENPDLLTGVLTKGDRALGEVGAAVRDALGPAGALSKAPGEVSGQAGRLLEDATSEAGQSAQRAVGGSGTALKRTTPLPRWNGRRP